MENFDFEYNILKQEICRLPEVKNVNLLKEELFKQLEKIKKSSDNDFKKESIRAMFITIDMIHRMPIWDSLVNGYVSTEIIDKDKFVPNSYFAINSLISRITTDSFDDIRFINENKYISKEVNDMFHEICNDMKFPDEDKLKKLKDSFSNRIKLAKLREYIEKTKEGNKKIDDLYACLIDNYYNKMSKDLEEILSVKEKLNEYDYNLLIKFKNNINKLKNCNDISYKLEKLIEYYEELNDLYNHLFERKRKIDKNDIKEASDELTIIIASELKEIKRSIPKRLSSSYESLTNELRRINLRFTFEEKLFRLNSLRHKINCLKFLTLDKSIDFDDENLYKYIYNFYFRKLDDDFSDYLVDNIFNKDIIDKYIAFKESIKSEDSKDVNQLINKIICLQNMRERINLDNKKYIKA